MTVGTQAPGVGERMLQGGAQTLGSWSRVHTQPCHCCYDDVSKWQGLHLGSGRVRPFPRQGWGVPPKDVGVFSPQHSAWKQSHC